MSLFILFYFLTKAPVLQILDLLDYLISVFKLFKEIEHIEQDSFFINLFRVIKSHHHLVLTFLFNSCQDSDK